MTQLQRWQKRFPKFRIVSVHSVALDFGYKIFRHPLCKGELSTIIQTAHERCALHCNFSYGLNL